MLPVPSRVVQSYHIRYQLGSIFDDPEPRVPRNIAEAIDLHVHAQTGTEDPLEIAKAATRAHMGGVVFKNLPGGAPRGVVARQVAEELKRWAEAEDLAPVPCYHGAQTDPGYGGLNVDQVRASIDDGARVVWFPVISSAHSISRVGAPRRALAGGPYEEEVVCPCPGKRR
jgi:hypothetical protein